MAMLKLPVKWMVFALITGAGIYSAMATVNNHQAMLDNGSSCELYSGLPAGFGKADQAGMVAVPGGIFTPGSTTGYPDERPGEPVEVTPFMIDKTEVTNAQFAVFVNATGYVTEAEKEGGAVVFQLPKSGKNLAYNSWWHYVEGANWQFPEGPNSDLQDRQNQPVVHITLADAQAYADWLGRDLPTEAQWEWAALGGGDKELLEREPRNLDGTTNANYWQGVFPYVNTQDDGFVYRSPVGCYASNGYGVKDMIGNVWEWTSDAYTGRRQNHANGDPALALASQKGDSTNSHVVQNQPAMNVIKGGSFLCARDYCVRYRASARHPQEVNLGVAHVGFRTVLNIAEVH